MKLFLKDFDYHLPKGRIAQAPAKPRDHSRLLVLEKETGQISHRHFYNLPDYLRSGDVLVLNNTKVFPARLLGHKKGSGGAVEVFLHRQLGENVWECLVGGRVKVGTVIEFGSNFEAIPLESNQDGTWRVCFNVKGKKLWEKIQKIGLVPLPPYIKRIKKKKGDETSYQTVFADARRLGSAAAPTAGLHFTRPLLRKIKKKGIRIVYITLHVGLGTFAPVKTENILEHRMHEEFVEIGREAAREIKKAKAEGRRVIAVGTTSCRALESADFSLTTAQSFWTSIFIYPGYKFKVVGALISNFHLPKSTLIMLVSALAGTNNIKRAYRIAIRRKYRFFSYGDSMFIS